MKNSKKLKMKWYMNYMHTFGYYRRMRESGAPMCVAISGMKFFARQQPEFCQAKRDVLVERVFNLIRVKFGRPNRAPECVQAYFKRKAGF